jgi:hypothetical protein
VAPIAALPVELAVELAKTVHALPSASMRLTALERGATLRLRSVTVGVGIDVAICIDVGIHVGIGVAIAVSSLVDAEEVEADQPVLAGMAVIAELSIVRQTPTVRRTEAVSAAVFVDLADLWALDRNVIGRSQAKRACANLGALRAHRAVSVSGTLVNAPEVRANLPLVALVAELAIRVIMRCITAAETVAVVAAALVAEVLLIIASGE